MAELLFFLEAFCISYLLTGAILRFSLKRRLLDIPNDRSSHVDPEAAPRRRRDHDLVLRHLRDAAASPVSGPSRPSTILAGALGGGAVIALGGASRRSSRSRREAQAPRAVRARPGVAVASGIVLREFSIPLIGSLDLGPLAVPATILWIVAIINFYNFIDGIDGLAAGIGLIASAFLYFISGMTGAAGLQSLYAVLAGSSFGFLRFNFPPARIFMGDMGSTFIGYVFAVLSVVGAGLGHPGVPHDAAARRRHRRRGAHARAPRAQEGKALLAAPDALLPAPHEPRPLAQAGDAPRVSHRGASRRERHPRVSPAVDLRDLPLGDLDRILPVGAREDTEHGEGGAPPLGGAHARRRVRRPRVHRAELRSELLPEAQLQAPAGARDEPRCSSAFRSSS